MFSALGTRFVIASLRTASLLPFPVLYALSDLLCFFVYHVFRYRRETVKDNIRRSFPGESGEFRKRLMKNYYGYLCDLIVEIIKGRSMNAGEVSERMAIRNPELVDRFFEEGRSVVVVSFHYGNWEWLNGMPLLIRHHHFAVYKPMENKLFEGYLNGIREKFGAEAISMSLTLRKLLESGKSGTPVLTGLVADQAPPWNRTFWTTFLNQETMFFDGPAKLAKRFNHPVIYQQIRRIKRGYYETWFELLCENPKETSEEEILKSYVRKASAAILADPVCYLWSHRRWKYSRPPGTPLH